MMMSSPARLAILLAAIACAGFAPQSLFALPRSTRPPAGPDIPQPTGSAGPLTTPDIPLHSDSAGPDIPQPTGSAGPLTTPDIPEHPASAGPLSTLDDSRESDSADPPTSFDISRETDSGGLDPAELHLLAGISAGLVAGGIAALAVRPWERPRRAATVLVWSTGGAAGAGVAKEIADLFGFGHPSIEDAVITAAGGFAVAGLVAGLTATARSDAAGTAISAGAIAGGVAVSIPVVRELVRRIRE